MSNHAEQRIIQDGKEARKNGIDKGNNPYRYSMYLGALWVKGWLKVDQELKPFPDIFNT